MNSPPLISSVLPASPGTVAVADRDRSSGQDVGRTRRGRVGFLLRRHAPRCDRRRATRFLRATIAASKPGISRAASSTLSSNSSNSIELPRSLRKRLRLLSARPVPARPKDRDRDRPSCPHLLDCVRESVVPATAGVERRRATDHHADNDDCDGDRGDDRRDRRAARHPHHQTFFVALAFDRIREISWPRVEREDYTSRCSAP